MTEPPVLIEVAGSLGLITLNRPRAINALSHEMVGLIHSALTAWNDDDTVRTVVLDGAGERGLCAGGDVRAIYHDVIGGGALAPRFWADEYRLNAAIASYVKPVVALMDGIVMGGAVGLAGHASHRVVNETSSIGMPEVTIGFSPDVGGTFLLSRAPGELGAHIGLTSARMDAGDAIHCGFADVFISRRRRPELLAALDELGADAAVRELSSPSPDSGLAADQRWIDECYRADTIEEILVRLNSHEQGGPAAATIARLSPTALKVTLRALRLAKQDRSVRESLARELRVSVHCMTNHDFTEGIRAQVIDKDRRPRWQPATLDGVSDAAVERCFGSLGADELDLTS